MAGEWFCKLAGVTTGPLSPQELKALATGGKLGPNDLVRHGDKGPWVPAVCIKGLLPKDGASAGEIEALVQPEAETARRGPAKYSARAPGRPEKSLPVAKPMDEPPAVPARAEGSRAGGEGKGRRASPKPAPTPAPNPTPVVVVADPADSAAAKALGRTPVHPGRRQRNNVIAIAVLAVAAVGLGVGGILFLVRDRGAAEPSVAKSPSGPKAGAAAQPDHGGAADAKPGAAAPDETEPPSDAAWIDASKARVSRGDVKVRVASARIGPAPASLVEKPGEYLLVTVEVQNASEEKLVRFFRWSTGSGSAPLQLADSAGNAYRQIVPGDLVPPASSPSDKVERPDDKVPGVGGDDRVGGPPARTAERIMPGESVEDLLVFEAPKESRKIEYLRLALPAAAFSGKGRLYFQIPKKMIRYGDEPDAPHAKEEDPLGPGKPGETVAKPKPKSKPGPDDVPQRKKDPGELEFEETLKAIEQMGGEKEEPGKDDDFEIGPKPKQKPAPKKAADGSP